VKCRSLVNHVLGNLREYGLSLKGTQKVLNEFLNLFMVSRMLSQSEALRA
jgi:hypothetical protein